MSLAFVNGAFRLKGVQTVRYEVPTMPPITKDTIVEVPTAAPEPVVEVPTAAEPEPEAVVVVEIPVSEVEAPAEVSEAAPETGLIPEDPAA